MSEELAPSAPAPTAAVIEAPTPNTPELGSQTPVAPKPEAQEKPDAKAEVSKSSGEAIKRASERLKAIEAEKAKTPDPKPDVKSDTKTEAKPADAERQRAQDGKFASKDSPTPPVGEKAAVQEPKGDQTSEGRKPYHEAPARLSENAKREWQAAPDSVKEDIHRVISENEKGIQKYKDAADRYEKVKEFDELARKNGREGVHESLKQMVEVEQAFARNPIEGLKKITDHFGLDLNAVASHIVGQNPNQQLSEAHGEVQRLRQQIQEMETAAKMPSYVQEFASKHEDFESKADNIAFVLKNGIVSDLEAAYEYVTRFSPASNAGSGQPLIPAQSASAQTQAPAPAPLNPAGSKSVSGAPTGGINPQSMQPASKSSREALQRAMSRVGT